MVINYNPDVLTCFANLSNDEVFTPPNLVNNILDLLPNKIWEDETVTFLDPVSKSGVFLREITKRLDKGLENKIKDKQQRINHILKNQVFGIGITELTALLSRRSVYCSKIANGKYSICDKFEDAQGNIIFNKTNHIWKNGSCIYCGASEKEYKRSEELESHAYQFIHTKKPEEVFNMRFDVIVGNPPYHLNDRGAGASAIPIYNKFVEQAIKLKPTYLTMIIPSRWFAGGKGLDDFRSKMLNDSRIRYLNDFVNAKECFPRISLGGGVCYFLWEKDYNGKCQVVNTKNGVSDKSSRFLNEYNIFVRDNRSLEIIKKVNRKSRKRISELISSRNPFGFSSATRGEKSIEFGNIILHSSQGTGFVSNNLISQGQEYISKYKVMFSKVTSEHAGEPDKFGKFRVLSTTKVLGPDNVCTDSYLIAGPFDSSDESENFRQYLTSKFARFLLLQAVTSINLSKEKFIFVPKVDFKKMWTDDELYNEFDLSEEDVVYINKLIKDYDGGNL